MKVLVSGASGLVGNALCEALQHTGHEVYRLIRDQKQMSDKAIFWDPEKGMINKDTLEGLGAVIHLSGENVAARWTPSKKRKILESRVNSTQTLVSALLQLKRPPKVFISASAIGYYGNRGNAMCIETSPPGIGFLPEVCFQWEKAAQRAEEKGIRTVYLRTGVVLSREGGALTKMLPAFKLGLGGTLGSGKQYISWISIDDLVGAILFILDHDEIQGPVNAVAPMPVTNAVFTKTLGDVLHRSTPFPVPALVLKLLLGNEMTEEILLGSTRASPVQLLSYGYLFKYPDLKSALRAYVKG